LKWLFRRRRTVPIRLSAQRSLLEAFSIPDEPWEGPSIIVACKAKGCGASWEVIIGGGTEDGDELPAGTINALLQHAAKHTNKPKMRRLT
jgi:hypothetical protein